MVVTTRLPRSGGAELTVRATVAAAGSSLVAVTTVLVVAVALVPPVVPPSLHRLVLEALVLPPSLPDRL